MKKAERRESINKQAYEMARTGQYKDYSDIEMTLRMFGHSEAGQVLNERGKRLELDLICQIAELAVSRGITYEEASKLDESKPFRKAYEFAMGYHR